MYLCQQEYNLELQDSIQNLQIRALLMKFSRKCIKITLLSTKGHFFGQILQRAASDYWISSDFY